MFKNIVKSEVRVSKQWISLQMKTSDAFLPRENLYVLFLMWRNFAVKENKGQYWPCMAKNEKAQQMDEQVDG